MKKHNQLKHIVLFSFIVIRILFADTTDVINRVNSISESLKKQYCPDKRTSVWLIEPQCEEGQYILRGETDNKPAQMELYRQIESTLPVIRFKNDVKVLPDDIMDGIIFAVPKNSIAILRRRPSVTEEMVTQTLRGLPLDILKEEHGFYLVRTDDGYLGWVSDDRVIEGDITFKEEWESSPKVVFVDLEGIVYSKPTKKAMPVSDVVMGNRFKIIEKRRKWTKVAYADGRMGYIRSKSLQDFEDYLQNPLIPENVIKTACSLIGRPYTWGAASPKEMDCSGFTQIVFRQNGYVLQRDASMQVFEGVAVDTADFPNNLKPADLIFFSPYPDRITHVGLYIGDYQFIHCSGRVRIDSFNPEDSNYNNYRRHSIRAVRRIIED